MQSSILSYKKTFWLLDVDAFFTVYQTFSNDESFKRCFENTVVYCKIHYFVICNILNIIQFNVTYSDQENLELVSLTFFFTFAFYANSFAIVAF